MFLLLNDISLNAGRFVLSRLHKVFKVRIGESENQPLGKGSDNF